MKKTLTQLIRDNFIVYYSLSFSHKPTDKAAEVNFTVFLFLLKSSIVFTLKK